MTMKHIPRNTISRQEKLYTEIFDAESHHNHPIIRSKDGRLRWKENKAVSELLEKISLNDLIMLFHALGFDKNSEVYRKLYRDMGYSLSGYWEIFYWEVNNAKCKKYKALKTK